MKKCVILSALLSTLILLLCACGQKAPTWQEQYDLGVRYLSEGSYEEAIIAFTAAIEIDPKQAQAYEKLADAYVYLNDLDSAVQVLEEGIAASGNSKLQEKLDELKTVGEPENEEVFQAESDSGNAELQVSGNTFSLSMDVPNLLDSYLVNSSEIRPSELECSWMVKFTDGINTYDVGTCHYNNSSREEAKEMTLYEMQSDVWICYEDNSASVICGADLEITGATLKWTFSIPEEYAFDTSNMRILDEIIEVKV